MPISGNRRLWQVIAANFFLSKDAVNEWKERLSKQRKDPDILGKNGDLWRTNDWNCTHAWHAARKCGYRIATAPRCRVFIAFKRGATTAEKLRGVKVRVPTTGACAPRSAKGRAGCCVWEGVAPAAVRVWGYHPRKISENSDAKSCIFIAGDYLLWNVLLFWKLRPRSWGTNTLLVPQPKRWGTSLPQSLRLLRLWFFEYISLFRWECDDLDNNNNECNTTAKCLPRSIVYPNTYSIFGFIGYTRWHEHILRVSTLQQCLDACVSALSCVDVQIIIIDNR